MSNVCIIGCSDIIPMLNFLSFVSELLDRIGFIKSAANVYKENNAFVIRPTFSE